MGILFAIATTISTISAAPPTPRDLLERGIRQEVITADIDAAIISYKDALAHKDIGPHTKLEATLRLAECQEILGNHLSAWIGYDVVAGTSSALSSLPTDALISKVSLLVSIAEEETAYDATTIHYVGDLLIGLEGALVNSEKTRALAIIVKTAPAIELLLDQAETFPDHRLLEKMQTNLAAIAGQIDSGQMPAALSALKESPFHKPFVTREALSDEDEVFGYALGRLDKVAHALAQGQDIRAAEALRAVSTYLAPLIPWPKQDDVNGTRHTYCASIAKLLTNLESAIIKGHLAEARLILDNFASKQAESGGMVHWHLEGNLGIQAVNPDILPHFGAAILHLESMLSAIEINASDRVKRHLKNAIMVAQKLNHLQANTSDESNTAEFLDTLQAMAALVDEEDYDEVRALLGTEATP